MKIFLAIIALMFSTSLLATDIAWPDLPKDGFVRGRPATQEDVKLERAVFAIEVNGSLAGKPLDIEVPQYAIHIEDGTGKETPVVVIQAEEGNGIKAVGYKVVGSSETAACLLRELRLLGTKKPG